VLSLVVGVSGMRRWSVLTVWVTAVIRTSANVGAELLVTTVMGESGPAVAGD
jgi:hypothetical protein